MFDVIKQEFIVFSEQWPHKPPHPPAHGDAGSNRTRKRPLRSATDGWGVCRGNAVAP